MKREEIEKEVFKLVLIANDHQILPQITTNKIMLLIDEYVEGGDTSVPIDYVMCAIHLCEPSANIRQIIERGGWTEDQLQKEAEMFMEREYPKGGDEQAIKKHFFNSMRKRKPQKDEQPTGDQAIRDFLNS